MSSQTADKSAIQDFALKNGIDLIGFARACSDIEAEKNLKDFVAEGRHGNMAWLEDTGRRVNPETLLPGAKSVIVTALNYYRENPPVPPGYGLVARYARGRDYHKVLKSRLKNLEKFILEKYPRAKTKICVDSAPISEKSYAVKAGLGFIGKNTTLITKEFGSFVVLGELLTDLEFDWNKNENLSAQTTDSKAEINSMVPASPSCGTCTRCLDSCPVKALIEPYKMDARRCISYQTIENKGKIPGEIAEKMGCGIFGCDICQEVCPYNKSFARETNHKEFLDDIAGAVIPLREILEIKDDVQYVARFAGSPLMRAKRRGLQRNAQIAQNKA